MYFKQFYLGCLAHASYLIGSDGEAAVVDPQRDVDQYIDHAAGKGYTAQTMAAMMYDSLHHKLLKLDDAVEVYPAHGAGSMCGKNLSEETSSTIGQQRKFNYALQAMTKDQFVKTMTTDLP